MFILTDEQIDYIIEMYGGSRKLINTIQQKLNLLGVIEDEEDYYEIIIAIVSQKETMKLKQQRCDTKREKMTHYMHIDQIIKMELNRKYNNFEDSKESIRHKMGM